MPTRFDRHPMRRRLQLSALLAGAVISVAAAPVAKHLTNWTTTVTVTPDGAHLLGNPDAKVKLTEYLSYTCPHCAHFNQEAAGTLRYQFVHGGKGSVEIRSFIRNPIDLAATLLVNCVDPARFLKLHDYLLSTQPKWMAKYAGTSDAQRQRWETGPMGARMRAIAGDMDFYAVMESNGYGRAAADRCLNDEAAMHRVAEQTDTATKAGVEATPSFAIDGVVLAGTYEWKMLEPQLQARM
jgi:protein-disulfide isomerase